jgi:hypothetical protein
MNIDVVKKQTVLKYMTENFAGDFLKSIEIGECEHTEEERKVQEPLKLFLENYIEEYIGEDTTMTIEELENMVCHMVDGYKLCLEWKEIIPMPDYMKKAKA